MTTEWMIRLAQCVVLVLVQVLFLNHIHLFGLAIPLLYIYIAITFRRGAPKWAAMLTSFFLGLVIDSFSGTPVRPAILVIINDWLISGRVYSKLRLDAAPKQALTPGQLS